MHLGVNSVYVIRNKSLLGYTHRKSRAWVNDKSPNFPDCSVDAYNVEIIEIIEIGKRHYTPIST